MLEHLQVSSDGYRNSFPALPGLMVSPPGLQCRLHGPANSNPWIHVFLIPNS